MGTTDTVQILSLISTPCFYEYSQRLPAFAKVVFLSIPWSFTMWINIPGSFSRKFCKVKSFTFCTAAAAAAKSLQSCLTLWDPIDGSPSGSPVPGILQARTLEWVAISFSNAGKWKVKVKSLSHVRLLATPWTAAHQAPLSMGFSR